jgi:hypothetical protein
MAGPFRLSEWLRSIAYGRMTPDGAIDPLPSLTTGRRAARTMCIKSGVPLQSEGVSLRLPYAANRHGE